MKNHKRRQEQCNEKTTRLERGARKSSSPVTFHKWLPLYRSFNLWISSSIKWGQAFLPGLSHGSVEDSKWSHDRCFGDQRATERHPWTWRRTPCILLLSSPLLSSFVFIFIQKLEVVLLLGKLKIKQRSPVHFHGLHQIQEIELSVFQTCFSQRNLSRLFREWEIWKRWPSSRRRLQGHTEVQTLCRTAKALLQQKPGLASGLETHFCYFGAMIIFPGPPTHLQTGHNASNHRP